MGWRHWFSFLVFAFLSVTFRVSANYGLLPGLDDGDVLIVTILGTIFIQNIWFGA